MKSTLSAIIFLFLFQTGFAEGTINVGIKYVSSESIYLDGGSRLGLQPGDRGEVYRLGIKIGSVEIAYLSEKSASCRLLEVFDDIRIGDEVIFPIQREREKIKPAVVEKMPVDSTKAIGIVASQRTPSRIQSGHFKGRVIFSSYAQDDLSRFDYDYLQPSLYMQGSYSHIAAPGAIFTWRLRLRKIERGSDRQSEWENRFYEVSLRKEMIPGKLELTAGRFAFSESPGIGSIDGLLAGYQLDGGFKIGGFTGFAPANTGENVQSDRLKAGISCLYLWGDYTTPQRLKSTIALTGIYLKGELEREFLYLSNDVVLTERIGFFQSSEIEINREWREKAEGSSLTLSSFYCALRWDPSRALGLTLGYDNRTPVRDNETRQLLDSLFDQALRQGIRGGLSYRLPYGMRIGFDTGYNSAEGRDNSLSGSGSISAIDILSSGISGTVKSSGYHSDQSNGSQMTAGVSRDVFSWSRVKIDGGYLRQKWTAGGAGEGNSRWLRLGGEVSFLRSFGALSYEWQRGDFGEADRIAVDIGTRF